MANYEYYKMFCKIVECQSISKAANQLYVSQPAVSLAIKQLENSLNAKLFFRTQKGVTLTTEGAMLYNYVKQGCTLINVGEEKLKELNALQAGEINIGASDMTLRFFLLPLIEKFHRNFPLVKIKITDTPTPETLQHLKQGLIDFGAVSEPVDLNNPNFKFKSVKSVKDILVAGDNFKELKNKQKVPVKELQKYPFIMLENGTSTRQYIENYFKKNNVEINPEIELATSDLVIEFIRRGMGVGFILEDFVVEDLRNGFLNKINLIPELQPRQFYIATHSHIPLASAAKKLLEYNDIDISDMNARYDLNFTEESEEAEKESGMESEE
ncbi:MAG: LysR family transcriptional regulator [Oscillospiraceae bacterium]|nr:LysR family transcriptional regulator [Oscillospiraceae bacterium]